MVKTAFTDYCPDRLFLSYSVFIFFIIFFVSLPCTRLSCPSRQLLSAHKYTVSYRSKTRMSCETDTIRYTLCLRAVKADAMLSLI